MTKKIFTLLTFILLSFLLASCNGSSLFKFDEEIIDRNISFVYDEPSYLDYKDPEVIINNLGDLTVSNNEYLDNGILFVSDDQERISVWNLFLNKLLFPFEDGLIVEYIYDNYFSCYFKTITEDKKTTIYDINGDVVLPTNEYSFIEINNKRVLKEPKTEADNPLITLMYSPVFVDDEYLYDYYEIIDYVIKGTAKRLQIKKIVDRVNKTKTEVETNLETYEFDNRSRVDLKDHGLDGYYMINEVPNLYIYKNDGKLVRKIVIEESSYNVMFDGKIFIQRKYITFKDTDDYDYEYDGNKYRIVTKTIDLLTGKVQNLKLDYIIESDIALGRVNNNAQTYLDSSGYAKYGFATIKQVKDKQLGNETNVIIDVDGKILYHLGEINPKKLIKVSKDLYYNPSNKYFYNSNLVPLYGINGAALLYKRFDMIIVDNYGKYGAIDFQGNVFIPFDYTYISEPSYNGLFGIDSMGKKYIISKSGDKLILPDNTTLVLPGLIYNYTFDITTSTANGKFSNYDDELLLSISYISNDGLPYYKDIDNHYDSGKLLIIQTSVNKIKYVVAKETIG